MKTIAIHSHKGGVGKTTIALLLAKHAAATGRKTCVADFDFIGSGMTDLFALARKPRRYLDSYFLEAHPEKDVLDPLLGRYADDDLVQRELLVMCNLGDGLPVSGPQAKRDTERREEIREEMVDLMAAEPRYREIQSRTEILHRRLAIEHKVELLIIDCHPGLGFVSETVRPLADLNVYLTTLNRSGCFGLLKSINVNALDGPNSFLVVNRADATLIDVDAFRRRVERDGLVGSAAAVIFSYLKYLGRSSRHFAAVPESPRFRRLLYLGESGHLPPIDPDLVEFAFLPRVMELVKSEDR